ncbi:putative uncharacterized protein [Parachlamydia acanthamoebae UV-7]|uniref:Uncharacterized protein n=2 Tax=Parachlamydia acanthamoebae TaxID=83552 RepID=F8L056_PARAV|nr:glucose-6-phosphate dehydrogenase assembly protein OpcA [Parachlamydia acanthamoebae]KIA77708.1 hypothetical protein DB43_FX00170 [Parachlamydia acanthamoebae]CCB86582.1 putative uncharacterized protein [Parachlamydia acanthamoebae UV-7]
MHILDHVPVASIETELANLWESQGEKNKIKACLFNLVIYTQDARRIPFFDEIVHSFIEKYPCRVIFIQGNQQEKDAAINVKVSNVILQDGNTLIGCDQIILEAGINQIHRIPFIILPLFVPDLPIYLLWGENPATETKILPYILEFANKLIFDSEWTEDLQNFSKKVLTQIDRLKIEVTDFNWATLRGWRCVLSQTFDTPDKIDILNKGAVLYISYNSKKTEFLLHNEINALYLQAWLAAQLGWSIESADCDIQNRHLKYSYQKHPIEVKLIPEEHDDSSPGDILSIEIYTKEGCSIEIAKKKDLSQVYVHMATPEKCELPFTISLPNLQRGFNFIKEVFYHSANEHYHNMLLMLSKTRWNTYPKD